MQLDLDLSGALNTQLAVVQQAAPVSIRRKGDAVIAPERPEAREARLITTLTPGKKRGEGLVNAAQHILTAREVSEGQTPVRAHRFQLVRLIVVVDALAAGLPCADAFFQRGIIQARSFAQLTVEKIGLSFRRVQAVFVREAHSLSLAHWPDSAFASGLITRFKTTVLRTSTARERGRFPLI